MSTPQSVLPASLSLSDACAALALLCRDIEALEPDGAVIVLSRSPAGSVSARALLRGQGVA